MRRVYFVIVLFKIVLIDKKNRYIILVFIFKTRSVSDIARLGRRLPLDERHQSIRILSSGMWRLLSRHATFHKQLVGIGRHRWRVWIVLCV